MENNSAGIFSEENSSPTGEVAQKQETKTVVDTSADPSTATHTSAEEPTFEDPKPYERVDWEKRYGDMRRYHDKVLKEKEDKISSLLEQVNSGKEWTVPKTKEDIEALKTSDPKLYEAIEHGVALRYDSNVEQLKRSNIELKKEAELTKLRLMHPDFMEIKETQEFKTWLKEQPQEINDWFYKRLDASLASRGLDLYKSTLTKTEQPDTRSAADQVSTKANVQTEKPKEKEFTLAEIKAMSLEEYEANRAQIDKQMRNRIGFK